MDNIIGIRFSVIISIKNYTLSNVLRITLCIITSKLSLLYIELGIDIYMYVMCECIEIEVHYA